MVEIKWVAYPLVAAHAATRAFIDSRARDSAPKTVDAYARNLDDLLRFFGDVPVERIIEASPADLQAYLAALRSRRPATPRAHALISVGNVHPLAEQTLAPATIRQRAVTARLFYDHLIFSGQRQTPTNPVRRGSDGRDGSYPKRGPTHDLRVRLPWIPSDAEWERLVGHIRRHEPLRTLAMVLLAYDGALRRQELVNLRLDDVDWSVGLITVRPELSKTGLRRAVTFSAATATVLHRYLVQERAPLLADHGGDPDGPLFLSVSGRNAGAPLVIGAFNDIIERLRREVDLPQLRTHTFRHLRCTVLRRCGIDQQDIALYAGHASVASTQIYIHLAPSLLARRIAEATAPFDARIKRLLADAAEMSDA